MTSKKKFSTSSFLGVSGVHPWKTNSFELLKKSVEAAVRKVPQKMDFYIFHVISLDSQQQSSSPLPLSSSSPNGVIKNGQQFPSSPYRSGGVVGPSYSSSSICSTNNTPLLPSLTSETLLNDIIWLGKTLSNLLTLAEMQKPSGHESDHTKRTAFEGFMGLVAHLNSVVQRLYVNYMDSSETIISYIKAKKMVTENSEYDSIVKAFEIGEIARKSSTKMSASSLYLILSQLLRGLTENPKICEWLFCDDLSQLSSSSFPSSSYLCGSGNGGGNAYY